MPQASTARCRVKAKILPAAVEVDPNNQWEKMLCKNSKEPAAEIVKHFENLFASGKQISLESGDMTIEPSLERAAAWPDIERDEEVQSTLVDDIVAAEGESTGTESILQTDRERDEDDEGPTDPVCALIPHARPLLAIFTDLKELAFDAIFPEVGLLLRQA